MVLAGATGSEDGAGGGGPGVRRGPLIPPVRNVLDNAHQELAELPTLLDAVHVQVDLPEPDEERVAELRERLLRQDT